MKKINWKQLLIPPMLFMIILLLSGCGNDGFPEDGTDLQKDTWCASLNYYREDECIKWEAQKEEVFYTQDQVNELLLKQQNDILDLKAYVIRIENELYNFYYTQDELDEGFEDILIMLLTLEQRIIELENDTPIIYTSCDMESIFIDMFDAFEDIQFGEVDGFYDLDIENMTVYYVVNNQVVDQFTFNDFNEMYCTVDTE